MHIEVLRPWVTKKVTQYIGFEDDIIINMVIAELEKVRRAAAVRPLRALFHARGFVGARRPQKGRRFLAPCAQASEHGPLAAYGLPGLCCTQTEQLTLLRHRCAAPCTAGGRAGSAANASQLDRLPRAKHGCKLLMRRLPARLHEGCSPHER